MIRIIENRKRNYWRKKFLCTGNEKPRFFMLYFKQYKWLYSYEYLFIIPLIKKILINALNLFDDFNYLAGNLILNKNKKYWTVEGNYENDREEIFSKKVKAGKRTYFFDVKATRSNDYYLTITESKRKVKD